MAYHGLYRRADTVSSTVGAFLGFYTVSSSILTGLSGVVYAVEPNKRILSVLHSNIVVNSASNTILIPYAVCPSNGFVKL